MKLKRMLSMGLATVLAAGMLAGCGSSDESQAASGSGSASGTATSSNVTPVGEYPIVNEPITFTIMGRKDPGAPDWSELEVFQRLSEITNINFEFEISESGTWTEQKNIALVGGEYGDIILRDDTQATTDEETYGPQGIFLDLTDLIDQYAPNIKAMMEKYPDVKAAMTSMDGKIYGLPYVFHTATVQGHTGFFSEEWMNNVGIDKVPETTDELYEMLKAFKEQDANGNGDPDDEIPFTCVGLTTTIRDLLIPAFTGLPDGLSFNVADDGSVVYAPATEEYKAFLEYANKLYEEGLLDIEFSTQTSQQWQAKVKANQCGVYSGSPTTLDPSTTANQLSLPPLTSPTNDKKVVKQPLYLYPGRAFITDKCEDPVAAIRLLDMFYATEENAVEGFCGTTLFAGWEGEHWQYTDDTKTAYEWIDPVTGFGDINQTVSVNMELPGLLEFEAIPTGDPLMEMKCEQVKEMQAPYYNTENAFPTNARFTAEESERGNVIENDLYNQVVMMTTKFITGDADIESGWEDYLASLDQIGLPELLEIKTAAMERWNAALNA
ncbi:MAG TPA: ABC transporter substrate-binding protein [Candidatus Ruthenibacterium merdigallinarum]|nr:ABC transporter substrate-binding protein [Candidatus Ruthenibacterium merdigallinarum]